MKILKYAIKKDGLYLQGIAPNQNYEPKRFRANADYYDNTAFSVVFGEKPVYHKSALITAYIKAIIENVESGKEPLGNIEIVLKEDTQK
jgi:hypothetical protein